MELIAVNNEGVGIDQTLDTYIDLEATVGRILFALFLKQLHLPALNWDYSPNDKKSIRVVEPENVLQLDALKIESVEASDLIYPAQAYSFFLLTQYLQIENPLRAIFLVPGRKSQFIFDLVDFQPITGGFKPKRNGLISLVKGIRNKKTIQAAHESFFVLIDQKFEERLNTTCLALQSRTGQDMDRNRWLSYCLDRERLKKMEKFSADLIQEL